MRSFRYLWHVLSEAWQSNSSFKGLRIPRHRWEDNINMDLQEVGCGVMDWIELAQYMGICVCSNKTSGSIKCGEFLD